jgi:hypothetical protein
MRKIFAALVALLMLAIVLQFLLAASGAFDTATRDESFAPHRALGYGILLFAVLLTPISALARMPGRLIGMTGLVAGLTALQGVIRAIASAFDETGGGTTSAGELVFGLHAVNALIILAIVGRILRRTRALESSRVAAPQMDKDTVASGASAGTDHQAS